MKIIVSTESTADLTKEQREQYNIRSICFLINLGPDVKTDGDIPNLEIFDYVTRTKQLPKTSAVNTFQYEEYFRSLLNECDEVVHIGFSSALSSAFQNATIAANSFNGKVHLIDSLSLSSGIGLLAIYAAELVAQGLSTNEIVEKVNARVKAVQASFVLPNVEYLYKGGRCSKVAFLGANIFHICPQILVTDGKMDAGKKYRGKFYNVVAQYVDDVLKQFNHPDLSKVFITYSSLDDEDNIVNMVRDKLIARGFKNVLISTAGSTIACHCGPNTIGILYINDEQQKE